MIRAKIVPLSREQAEHMGKEAFAKLGIPTLYEMTNPRLCVYKLTWLRDAYKISRTFQR